MKRRETIAGSSAISAASWDDEGSPDGNGTLEITFTSGRSFTFRGVPESVFDGLLSADSAGGYYNSAIKGVYS